MEEEKGHFSVGGRKVKLLDAALVGILIIAVLGFVIASQTAPKSPDVLKPGEIEPNVSSEAYAIGNRGAKVEVQSFFDYQCPFCAAAEGKNQKVIDYLKAKYGKYDPPAKTIIEKYAAGKNATIRYVYRDFPILGPESWVAANAARCAGEQGKYLEYHNYLFDHQTGENQGDFTAEKLVNYAGETGLEKDQFQTCLTMQKYQLSIEQDAALARSRAILGTPAFLVNGKQVPASLDALESAIKSELAK